MANLQKQINQAIEKINKELEKGDLGPQASTMNLVVFVAKTSPRKWFIGYNFQQKTAQVGDTAIVAHPEVFITKPEIVHIF